MRSLGSGIIRLLRGSDNNGVKQDFVSSSQNRFWVSSILPGEDILSFSEHLDIGGGSIEGNVDGSVTPVDLSKFVPSGEIWYLMEITVVLIDPGTMANDVFGSLPVSLGTPGLEYFIRKKSVDYRVVRVRDNAELVNEFTEDPLVVTSIGTNAGMLDTIDVYRGSFSFESKPVRLVGDDGDGVFVRVNNDLTEILRLLNRIQYIRKI